MSVISFVFISYAAWLWALL